MRYPIQRQLLWPMLVVVLLGTAVTAILAAWLGMRALRLSEQARLHQLAGTVADAGFPLTDAVLKRLSNLSGATYITLDDSGRILHSSREFSAADQAQLSRIPSSSAAWDSAADVPVQLQASAYRAVRIPVKTASKSQPVWLVILTSQERWDALAWQAALPPLFAGLISATIAVVLAVVLSRRFVQRIQSIADRAMLLAEGQFSQHDLPLVDDELRDLASAMNSTAVKLERFEQQVRQGERLQTLGRLGAGMAHQLRNAITGARMAIDLHQSELASLPNSESESLVVAVRQLTLMESYLQRFLRTGRGETIGKAALDLPRLISEAIRLVQPLCKHQAIQVAWQPPELFASYQGDLEALRQMLLNLLLNAVEAVQSLPVAQRQMGVDLERKSDTTIQLLIWDAGPGPTAEIAARLFEPFTTNKPDGTGLGLVVAKEIAEAHDGTIRWQRTHERTEFVLELR